MTDRSYNRAESIVICDKDFNFTPDRKEFLAGLTSGGYEPQNVTPITPSVQPAPVAAVSNPAQMPVAAKTASVNLLDNVKIIPEKMINYVPFGHFKDVKGIIKSKLFFPVFVND